MRRLQRIQYVLANAGVNGLQGRDEIHQEAREVIVALVEREPGNAPIRSLADWPIRPFAQQRGLAKAGRGRDERQLAIQARDQLLAQARARHQLRSDRRNMEFGGQKRHGHDATILPRFPNVLK